MLGQDLCRTEMTEVPTEETEMTLETGRAMALTWFSFLIPQNVLVLSLSSVKGVERWHDLGDRFVNVKCVESGSATRVRSSVLTVLWKLQSVAQFR